MARTQKIGSVQKKRIVSKEKMDSDYSESDSDTLVVKVWKFTYFAND
jgi:hypothetical protein